MHENYREIARKLNVHYLFGRWGLQLLPKDPGGKIYRLFTIVPLDGWVTDSKEVERIIRERGMEL